MKPIIDGSVTLTLGRMVNRACVMWSDTAVCSAARGVRIESQLSESPIKFLASPESMDSLIRSRLVGPRFERGLVPTGSNGGLMLLLPAGQNDSTPRGVSHGCRVPASLDSRSEPPLATYSTLG